ncbi:MAG: V-type ATPase subunit, partial [Treponema sp.]|nr:V-type ATPase subunit [Treponema sp.]
MPVTARQALGGDGRLARSPSRLPVRTAAKTSHDTGERAFAFAKACGIIGKSFIGKRITALEKLHSLNELDRLVFPEISRELPGRELLHDLENRILQRTTRHILAILDSFSRPPELLIRQLCVCEYTDLKTCLHHISAGKPIPSMLSDIGRFRTVRFKAYPDIAAMLAGTEFEFILSKDLKAMKSADFDFTPIEAELDLHYYTLLVQSLGRLSSADSMLARRILADEISLRNCVWALRLRTYFRKKPDEAAKYLMDQKISCDFTEIPGAIQPKDSGGEISLAAEASASLQFALDTRSDWENWRWESLLNPEKPGGNWIADPRYFQNAASRYIYRLSLRCFRLMPFSINSIFCYIKLKQFEEDLLTSITEGLGLGMAG